MDYIVVEVVVIVAVQILWPLFSAPKVTAQTEVERIAGLQQAAIARRAEYAAEWEQAAPETALAGPPPPSRKRVEDAERAYAVALQAWENGQSRQKSR